MKTHLFKNIAITRNKSRRIVRIKVILQQIGYDGFRGHALNYKWLARQGMILQPSGSEPDALPITLLAN